MHLSPLPVLVVSVLAALAACGPSSPVGRDISFGGASGSNPDRNAPTAGRTGSGSSPAPTPDGTRVPDAGAPGDAPAGGTAPTPDALGPDASGSGPDLSPPPPDVPATEPPAGPPGPDAAPTREPPPQDAAPPDRAPDGPPIPELPPIEGALPCPEPLPAGDVISDFEGGSLATTVAPGRGGTTWTVIALRDGATGAVSAPAIPPRCGSTSALRFSGLSSDTQAPIVRALMVATGADRFFDASAYKGVRLALRAATPSRIRMKISDRNTATPGGICVACNDHFSANLTVGTEWRTYTVPFSGLRQLGIGDPQPALLTTAIFAIELVVPRVAAEYELFVDDVGFSK